MKSWPFTSKASASRTSGTRHRTCLTRLGVNSMWMSASPGSNVTPWIPAEYFVRSCGLGTAWDGFVWMNPPFGGRNGIVPWLEKFFAHGNGVALTPDRTSAPWWQEFAPRADLILFVGKKLKFIAGFDDPEAKPPIVRGQPGRSPAQGTCLMAAGLTARESCVGAPLRASEC